jgi:hypothetical protein
VIGSGAQVQRDKGAGGNAGPFVCNARKMQSSRADPSPFALTRAFVFGRRLPLRGRRCSTLRVQLVKRGGINEVAAVLPARVSASLRVRKTLR